MFRKVTEYSDFKIMIETIYSQSIIIIDMFIREKV